MECIVACLDLSEKHRLRLAFLLLYSRLTIDSLLLMCHETFSFRHTSFFFFSALYSVVIKELESTVKLVIDNLLSNNLELCFCTLFYVFFFLQGGIQASKLLEGSLNGSLIIVLLIYVLIPKGELYLIIG